MAEVLAALRCDLHLGRNGSDVALMWSHDRLAAKEPGRWRSVKAASRRSRSRVARALTGLRRSGSGVPSGQGSVRLVSRPVQWRISYCAGTPRLHARCS